VVQWSGFFEVMAASLILSLLSAPATKANMLFDLQRRAPVAILEVDVKQGAHHEPASPADSLSAYCFGRVGPDGMAVIGIRGTLYLLSLGQGFVLPWREHASLRVLPSGDLSIVTSSDTIPVSQCAESTQTWAWASPFQNPRPHMATLHGSTYSDAVPPETTLEGKDAVFGGTNGALRKRSTEERLRAQRADTSHGLAPTSSAPLPKMRDQQTERIDARLYPHPPVIHILGLRHTALVELWYEGDQEVQGVHLLVEPRGEAVSIVSAEPMLSDQQPFSLTYGKSTRGGLQIRLASESSIMTLPGPVVGVLLESRHPGTSWIHIEDIVVGTEDSAWRLPDDSLQVYVEE
jgi:hypothetical protein